MHITRKISKFSGLFYRIKRVDATKLPSILCYALVLPDLLFCVINWVCACKAILVPLQVI